MNLFDLTGKNAVVIGGSGGIGKAIAKGLAEAGANTLIASRKEESLIDAKKDIENKINREIHYLTVDATNEESIEKLVSGSIEKLGNVDILVNAQGFNKKHPAEDFPMDVFKAMFDVNVYGVMMTCKHFGKHMIENGYGKIVNISSVRGRIATKSPGNTGYCGTKGAIDMVTRQLASEYGSKGITVNAIGPTVTETPMMKDLLDSRGPNERERIANLVPMKRMATPEDCVGPAIFLCSDASGFVTGNILYPDGGLTAVG